MYPSASNLGFLQRKIEPIGSENELRHFEQLLVKNMVKIIFEEMEKDVHMDESLYARGRISFENQVRFREAEMMAAIERVSISDNASSQPRNTRAN